MNYFTARKLATAAVFVATAAASIGLAHAQVRDAGSKIRGDYGMSQQSTSRSLYHARDYANDYRSYVQDVRQSKRPVTAQVAKEHADEMGHNIKMTQKHLAEMRKHAANDKETLASLNLIDKYVQEADKHQATMLEMCKGDVDADGSMKCCEDAGKSLDKAIAEHDKLMKKLAAKKTTTK